MNKSMIEDICPECVFKPKYPQLFKFELVVNSKNYGNIELEIKQGLEISSLSGDKNALNKLDEIAKKQANRAFYYIIPDNKERYISYPLKDVLELITALYEYEEVKQGEDLEELRNFVSNVLYPVDTELLYEKTGIFMTD